jgi:putative superfamily III holin-X
MSQSQPPRPGMIDLARQLVGGVIRLAKLEVTQGRQEIGQMLAEAGRGAALIGIAVAILIVGLVTFDIVIVLGVAALFDVLPNLTVVIIIVALLVVIGVLYVVLGGIGSSGRLPGWAVAAVAVGLLLMAAAFAFPAYLGFRAAWHTALFVMLLQISVAPLFVFRGISHVKVGPPEQTIASVKEDIAWAKRLLRRG